MLLTCNQLCKCFERSFRQVEINPDPVISKRPRLMDYSLKYNGRL